MRHLFFRFAVSLLTFIIGLVSASILSPFRTHQDTSSNSEAEQEVLRVEHEYIDAHLRGDVAALNDILADEFVIKTHRRILTDKAHRLALLENNALTLDTFETKNVSVEVSGDSAVVTGDAVIRSSYYGQSDPDPIAYSFTRLYEKREGRWQIISTLVSY